MFDENFKKLSENTGIILFAHGSRDVLWRKPIENVTNLIKQQQPLAHVVCAYLELCNPSLTEAIQNLINKNTKEIHIIPFFLGVGKHVREDLPMILKEINNTHPQVLLIQHPPICESEHLIFTLSQIIQKNVILISKSCIESS